MAYKKRKPFLVRLFLWIFWLILFVGIAFLGLWGYFYFAKNVDVVGAISTANALSQPVDEATLISKPITASDAQSVGQKLEGNLLTSITITDKELGAYINQQIESGTDITFGGFDLSEMNFEVLQFEITLPTNQSNVLANLNLIFKFDSTRIKQQMTSFPLSLIKDKIPDIVYVSASGNIEQSETEAQEYSIKPENLKINNLSPAQTANMLNLAAVFVADAKASNLNTVILEAIVTPILGNQETNGLLQNLNAQTPVGYEATIDFVAGGVVISVVEELYQVQVLQQIAGASVNAAEVTGTGFVWKYGQTATLTVTPKSGYNFEGWFMGATLVSTNTTLTIDNMNGDTIRIAKFSYIQHTITYLNTKDAPNANPTTYNISNGTITLVDLQHEGYTFKGWFTEQNGGGDKISSIASSSLKDYIIYAHWEITTYSISYNLNGGTLISPNAQSYTIETTDFQLVNPSKAHTQFVGWTGTNLAQNTINVVIHQGTTGDLAFTAHYMNDIVVSLCVDGEKKTQFDYTSSQDLTVDIINANINPQAYGLAGYSLQNWFVDEDMTIPFEAKKYYESLALYSTPEYFTDEIEFYPYLSEFQNAVKNNSTMNFDSRQKLLAWMDFVVFYHIEDTADTPYPKFNLTYIQGDAYAKFDEVEEAFQYYAQTRTYQSVFVQAAYSNVYFFLDPHTSDSLESMASLTADQNKTHIQPQTESALCTPNTNPRNSSFDNFKINNITKTLSVSNSEQLVHALEQGYRPVCQQGSTAETVYNLAKNVLRQICNDTMTDAQKLQAIYEWLVLNVEYDHYAQDNYTGNTTRYYKSWFAEGVFVDNVAVCEGFAKATVILSRLEGIPAVIVTNPVHAWNKVMVDGKWFGFDATHGNFSDGTNEMLTYQYFLFTDSYRPNFIASEYTNLVANTQYNFYTSQTLYYNGQAFDRTIDSSDEMSALLQYAKSNTTKSKFTIEFTGGQTLAVFPTLNQAIGLVGGLQYSYKTFTDCNNKTVYLFCFTKTA